MPFFNGGSAEPIIALVKVPTDVSMIVTKPRFEMILHSASILFVVSFVMLGSLESLLTAVAIEKKDPWKRRNNMNRELWSKSIANSAAACNGGIPMIAEVVRSSTNIMVGARTRWSNIFHGSFILLFLVALPFVLNMIPLALQTTIFGLLFLGFAVKAPLPPFHTWLPSVAMKGPAGIAIFLVGLKMGTFGMLKVLLPIAPHAAVAWQPVIVWIGIAAMLYAGVIALAQSNMRKMLAYASVSHVGLVVAGIFSLKAAGLQGSVMAMVNFGLASTVLMLLAGSLHQR